GDELHGKVGAFRDPEIVWESAGAARPFIFVAVPALDYFRAHQLALLRAPKRLGEKSGPRIPRQDVEDMLARIDLEDLLFVGPDDLDSFVTARRRLDLLSDSAVREIQLSALRRSAAFLPYESGLEAMRGPEF